MFVAACEWTSDRQTPFTSTLPRNLAAAQPEGRTRQLYDRLASGFEDPEARLASGRFLRHALAQVEGSDCELPEAPQDLAGWMHHSAQRACANYRAYLEARKSGQPRRYFHNRAHALYFLRAVAPTKLVDGAWLAGLMAHWQNPRFAELITTYVEELGEGQADKNHVVLYRNLLAAHGLTAPTDLPEDFYTQGVLQLALGANADEFLPEVIGFNLGYEQLPLHLMITAYELNELGIDPYYFTLHITVDNADTGHAQRAVQAVLDTLPRLGDGTDFWRRVRNGCKLSNAGTGTTAVIAGFDLDEEVKSIFARKSVSGLGAHSDYCRVAGRSVNDWLAQPDNIPGFLAALQQAGWIQRGAPVEESRFWKLLQGEKAQMFGVFSAYELQLTHDWLRGDASADGQAYDAPALAGQRRATYTARARLLQQRSGGLQPDAPQVRGPSPDDVLDPDLQALQAELAAVADPTQKKHRLIQAMAPSLHWTPAGMYATRAFVRLRA